MMRRPTPEGICIECRRTCTVGHKRCKACYRSQTRETPLRRWARETGRSLEQLSRQTRVSVRALKYIAAGDPASTETALVVEKATGISLEQLLEGAEL
jgi:hypothetical protein